MEELGLRQNKVWNRGVRALSETLPRIKMQVIDLDENIIADPTPPAEALSQMLFLAELKDGVNLFRENKIKESVNLLQKASWENAGTSKRSPPKV